MESREALYDKTMDYIESYASVLAQCHSNPPKAIAKLTEAMVYYNNAKAKYVAVEKALADSTTLANDAKTKEEADEIFDAFNSKIAEISQMKTNKSDRVARVKGLYKGSSNTDDDDLQVTQSTVNTIDPISRKRMVDPVKNKKCGHHYEKTVVLELLAKQPKTRCPIIGCVVPVILPKDLVPDDQLKRYLERTVNDVQEPLDQSAVSLNDTI